MSLVDTVSYLVAFLSAVAAAGWAAWLALLLRVQVSDIGWWIAVAAASGGAVGYLFARYVATRAFRPLEAVSRALTEAAFQPRDQIRYARELPAISQLAEHGEIGSLLTALDQFLGKIQRRHARQTAWIGAVVHDLKTPLVACINALEAIADKHALCASRTGSDTSVVAKRLAAELRTLVHSVQKMVDVVRFEREDVTVDRETVDLASMTAGVIARFQGQQGIDVRCSGQGFASGDPELLQRALVNLVGNAVRYARSRVSVEVYPGLLRVSDDGPGLPAPLEVLAEPFRSEPLEVGSVTVSGGAAGIGLFLARRVLELHGGKLVVENTSNEGTTLLAYVEARRAG